MLNQTSAFSHDEDISVIFKEIKDRNQNKSAVIRSLLHFYRDNGYQIPVIAASPVAFSIKEETEGYMKERKAEEREEG